MHDHFLKNFKPSLRRKESDVLAPRDFHDTAVGIHLNLIVGLNKIEQVAVK